MRPPICAICDKDFDLDSKGDLLEFVESEEDKQFNQRLAASGHTGHPAHQEWFCAKHIKKARKLTHLTRREALQALRSS